jgi:hypothetical protein
MKGFQVAGASVPGTDHIMPGEPGWKNNQDAFSSHNSENALVAVVCDGCGSGSQSEVGAQLGAAFTARRLAQFIEAGLTIESALEGTANHLSDLIVSIASAVDGDVRENVGTYFLFTVVGVLVTPERTVVFSLGDGVYAVNGDTSVIAEYAGNAPPYIGYRVTGWSGKELLTFAIRSDLPTSAVSAVLIGTDGAADLIKSQERNIPGTNELVGPLSQFWENDVFFRNSDALRRRLARANRETVSEDGKRIRRGLLPDDTTLMVVRRSPDGIGGQHV